MFYDRIQGNQTFSLLSNPPTTRTPQVFFGNLDTLASGSQSLFPVAVQGNAPDGYVPTTYNWNLSIQRELPFKLLFDIAYVGSSSAHLLYQTLLNEPAFGSAWLPENQDPTAGTPRFDGSTTLAVNFTRPYPGYGTIRVQSFGASSNYHALELAVNRRLSRSLQFGLAYTWSKVLGTADSNTSDEHPTDLRNVNYGLLTFDRTHNLVVNYIYDFPKLARGPLLNNGVGRALLNNWTLSGL